MAVRVPDTESLKLSQIIAAVEDHAGPLAKKSLYTAYQNAISSYFDPTYDNDAYGTAGGQRRWRNYGPPALTTPSFVASIDLAVAVSGTSASINSPGGISVGNIMFLFVTTTAKTTISTPTGYTLVYKVENSGTYPTWGVFYKIVTAGDIGGSVTVNLGASGYIWAEQVVYTCSSSSPYFNTVTSANYDAVASSTSLSPSISGCTAGSKLILFTLNYIAAPSSFSLTDPSGWDDREGHNLGNYYRPTQYDKTQISTGGTSDSCTLTASVNITMQALLIELLAY
jgi:hypothetical protein